MTSYRSQVQNTVQSRIHVHLILVLLVKFVNQTSFGTRSAVGMEYGACGVTGLSVRAL
ncbi:hypothetical protein QZH41_020332 [Actinostola sp. cb2023]|nr:hypothetical protein QZH41_020332 [Actinostola sp. cb2023]